MTVLFTIFVCLVAIWLQWKNLQLSKRIEQSNLDLGFAIGRGLGRAEADERWSYRLRLVTEDIDAARTLADFEAQSAGWVTESKNRALEAGVSRDRVQP